ncbi:hypothetical protein PIIN_00539 [Serendipita indica DSM 11827]|uniref:Uncharacterized protein n=1 Tax=Serendipita indica (strain DSM 11827) TaxID=1109443 RepID=G4U2V0_SERID|nr:hypothetical protein PIIN_00539 [Serendipita indica DSM 11827]
MADASGQSSVLLSSQQETTVSSTILSDTSPDIPVKTVTEETVRHGRPAPTESSPVSEDPLPSPTKSTESSNDSTTDSVSTTEEIKPLIVYAPPIITTSSSEESSTSTASPGVEGLTTASDETAFADTESAPTIMRLSPLSTTVSQDNVPSKSVTSSQTRSSATSAAPTETPSANNIQAQNSDAALPLFTSATTFSSLGGFYAVSAIASTFETVLPNGDTITSTRTLATTISLQTTRAQTNEDNIRGGGAPSPPGTYTPEPNSIPSTAFFKRPAAAAGVFVAVSLVLGCFVWMFFLLRRHRRQAATAKDRKRHPYYAYGSTGVSPRDRGSFMSYDARNWPERFEEETYSVPSTPIPPPALEPSPAPAWRPGYTRAFGGGDFPEAGPSSPTSPTLADRHQYLQSSTPLTATVTSNPPPVPSRSPYRPVSTTHARGGSNRNLGSASHMDVSAGNLQGLEPTFTLQHASLTPLSRTLSSSRPRPRALSSSVSVHPYPTNSSLSTISDSSEPKEPHPIVLFRRTSDRSTDSQQSDVFRSSAYVVPSPSSLNRLQKAPETLKNPFADADSPPPTPVGQPFVRDQEEGSHIVRLDRGVSLRRNDTWRNRPEHHLSTTPEPSVAECSGTEAGTSTSHLAATPRLRLLLKTAENRIGRKSESMSTAETSTGGDTHVSPVESELFYSLDFMRAAAAEPGSAR